MSMNSSTKNRTDSTADSAADSRTHTDHRPDLRSETESRELLTVEQAAGYLQLSQSSIRSYIRQGTLKAFRIAGLRKVLIPRQELLKLLEPT